MVTLLITLLALYGGRPGQRGFVAARSPHPPRVTGGHAPPQDTALLATEHYPTAGRRIMF